MQETFTKGIGWDGEKERRIREILRTGATITRGNRDLSQAQGNTEMLGRRDGDLLYLYEEVTQESVISGLRKHPINHKGTGVDE